MLLITLTASIYAQKKNCEEFIQTEFIDKIKDYKPTDLVPYSKDGKNWGLMDVKSKKAVTKSVLKSPTTFKNDFHFYLKNYEVWIEQTLDFTCRDPEVSGAFPKKLFTNARATKESLGFLVNENGEMTAYSKNYKRKENFYDSENISEAIKYNNEYFAVLHKADQDVLINQKGEEQKGFIFKEIHFTDYTHNNNPLLYVRDFDNNFGFMLFSGKRILFGKMISNPLWKPSPLGYSVQHNGGNHIETITKSGVLDLTNQKWLIKPQTKYKIYKMIYTSSEKIDETNLKNRKKANIYFLATENGTEHFVLDINGKTIKPKL